VPRPGSMSATLYPRGFLLTASAAVAERAEALLPDWQSKVVADAWWLLLNPVPPPARPAKPTSKPTDLPSGVLSARLDRGSAMLLMGHAVDPWNGLNGPEILQALRRSLPPGRPPPGPGPIPLGDPGRLHRPLRAGRPGPGSPLDRAGRGGAPAPLLLLRDRGLRRFLPRPVPGGGHGAGTGSHGGRAGSVPARPRWRLQPCPADVSMAALVVSPAASWPAAHGAGAGVGRGAGRLFLLAPGSSSGGWVHNTTSGARTGPSSMEGRFPGTSGSEPRWRIRMWCTACGIVSRSRPRSGFCRANRSSARSSPTLTGNTGTECPGA